MAEIQELLLEGALGPLAFRPMVTLTQLSKERAGLKAFYCPDPKDKNWAIELNGNPDYAALRIAAEAAGTGFPCYFMSRPIGFLPAHKGLISVVNASRRIEDSA